MGLLWEHYVLNELFGRLQGRRIQYWRDKRHHEVDFVLRRRGQEAVAIECKWSADNFEPAGVKAFRRAYRKGMNYVVAHDVKRAFHRGYNGVRVEFVGLDQLIAHLSKD